MRLGLLVIVLGAVGCLGIAIKPERPALNPAHSAEQAIRTYDTTADGEIDEQEVTRCPGLVEAFASIDRDQNGRLSAVEIESRIRYFKQAPTVITQGEVRVTYQQRPLAEANVTFEPESFLGPAFAPCEGTTNANGVAHLQGPDPNFPGIYLGFYRVRISKKSADGVETMPAKYNEQTKLGYEVTDDTSVAGRIEFQLQ